MDWVSNAPHGVALAYNYWSHQTWQEAFASLNLSVGVWKQDLQLYPNPANLVFGRSLHFISRLDQSGMLVTSGFMPAFDVDQVTCWVRPQTR